MHILIVNDDGPPSNQSSPYVHSLVTSLQDAGHTVSVVLPHTQRSWIGKAHIIGQTVKPTYFRPGTLHQDDGTTHSRPLPPGSKEQEEWILVDGTPASCVQIGLYHYFQDRGPIDLVVSGPNYGRNSTAVFSLSSGTLGGALEAAVCQKKAIALSYAFFSRNHDPAIIAGASKLSVRLIEHLYKYWGMDVDLYSVNVPLVENVETRKIFWTHMLQNYWGPGSCFQEVEDEEGDPSEEEQKIREREGVPEQNGTSGQSVARHKHKHFKWSPRFTDVFQSVEKAGAGNDGWAVKEGYTSVTPLKANFMHAAAQTQGELKLYGEAGTSPDTLSLTTPEPPHFYALINYEDEYVQPLILSALQRRLPEGSYTLISSPSELPSPDASYLHIGGYENLPFEHNKDNPKTSLINAYLIRKALIRKHYLCTTAFYWITKYPYSVLVTNIKPAFEFELDYAEFLDEYLEEAWDLHGSFRNNEGKEPAEREWWILKPGMTDGGQGLRLFSTMEEMQAIFDMYDGRKPKAEREEDEEGMDIDGGKPFDPDDKGEDEDFIIASDLRHFVTQKYIHPPLLLPFNPRKFHIRTYVLAAGSLKVYVYKRMLALFASAPYVPPWESVNASSHIQSLAPHLTNTCLHPKNITGRVYGSNPPVQEFSALSSLSPSQKSSITKQICEVTGEIFEAAVRVMMTNFQTAPNMFEVFGLDFIVDAEGTAWLLEVNAYPDYKQTGAELKGLVEGLWSGVVEKVVAGFFGVQGRDQVNENGEIENNMVLVRDLDLGRR